MRKDWTKIRFEKFCFGLVKRILDNDNFNFKFVFSVSKFRFWASDLTFWISCFITQANILIRFISATEEMQVFLKTIYLKKICFQFEACDVILWHLNPYNFCGIKDNYGR